MKIDRQNLFSFLLIALLMMTPVAFAEEEHEEESLDAISQKLENPLTTLWSLSFQNNTDINNGDLIEGSETANAFLFQPALPIPVGEHDQFVFTARPVFPIVTQPVFNTDVPGGIDGRTTGFGDMQILSLFGPSKPTGFVWGAGITMKLPTASNDSLGQNKWQAGPAVMAFYIKRPWTSGVLVQHWSSFAGDDDAPDRNRTDIQYIIRRGLPHAWSIGMGPTVTIDWEKDSENNLTLPVGLGLTKTVRFGRVPTKLRLEAHYSLIKPELYGSEWTIRIQVTPIIKSPFRSD